MKYFLILFFPITVFASSIRIKDLVTIKGVRENPVIGYGLVVGLNGTGDGGTEITSQSLKKMFKTLGLDPKQEVEANNVASVVVTASLPPFARTGQKVDIVVSSIGAANSLAGGTLLVTPLKGGDGVTYGIASGQVSIGGLKNGALYPTTGRVPDGAILERDLELKFTEKNALRISLKRPDFTTSARITKTINRELGGQFAISKDATTIDLIVPEFYKRRTVELMAIIENFKVVPDQRARIVINERTGTIVAGGDIPVAAVSLSHRDLLLKILPEGGGEEKSQHLHSIEKSTSINDLLQALNALGTTPEDLISIFQALKENGAINAEIETI